MLLKQQEFYRSLTTLSPGLVERIGRTIEDAEKKFSGKKEGRGGFLWEHSVLVAAQLFRLATAEKESADLAALTALFHDSGKFADGRYHADDKPEEEEAARLAREFLEEAGPENGRHRPRRPGPPLALQLQARAATASPTSSTTPTSCPSSATSAWPISSSSPRSAAGTSSPP